MHTAPTPPFPETPRPRGDAALERRIDKEVTSAFTALVAATSRSAETVFDHLLEFILSGFTVGGHGLPEWPYDKEQTGRFTEMFRLIASSLGRILETRPWYDFFGVLYEFQVAGRMRKSVTGQFFTPMNVCDLMAALTQDTDKTIYDPCCGSGRMLLAGWSRNRRAAVLGQDLDRTCCLMTACNLLLHGCTGTVRQGNSLLPDDVREEWAVNPYFSRMPVLHIIKTKTQS